MNRAVRVRLGAMLCAAVLLLAATGTGTAATAAPAARNATAAAGIAAGSSAALRVDQLGRLVVHTSIFEVEPTGQPQLFTTACDAGEQLVSGGYASADGMRLVFSYPSAADGTPTADGAQPTAWTVGIVNAAKTVPRVQVSAACLAGGTATTTVSSNTKIVDQSSLSLSAACPGGTQLASGGYASQWNPRSGIAAVTGSYPNPDDSWGIDVVLVGISTPAAVIGANTVTAFAVCVDGSVQLADVTPTPLTLTPGTPNCTGLSAGIAVNCVTPFTGNQLVGCADGQILSGGGYQVTDGALPGPYSVLVNAPVDKPVWIVQVNGTSSVPTAPSLNVTALCLVAVATPVSSSPAGGGGLPTTTGPRRDVADNSFLVVGGISAGVLLLIVLALLAALALRRSIRNGGRERRQRPPSSALTAVVRAQRSAYRLHDFRETT
ncbi:MAG TPA: hypothetical protein VKB59_04585 [Micromonosporaceae bacterium]|nr:hypothetical protein [Micromonosporaceae bacterium]